MNSKSILRNLTALSLALAGTMTKTSTAFGQATSPEGHYRTGHGDLVLVVGNNCKSLPCELKYQGARVRIYGGRIRNGEGSVSHRTHVATGEDVSTGDILIRSNLPVNNIELTSDAIHVPSIPATQQGKEVVLRPTSYDKASKSGWRSLHEFKERNDITVSPYGHPFVNVGVLAVSVQSGQSGTVNNLAEDMKSAALPMVAVYQRVSEHLADFRQIVARDSADARHLARLETHLKNTLKIMVDEKGAPLLPVTHRRVTEGSRMIMVLSTVLEEITDKYDFNGRFLEPLKPAKEALGQLSQQIRAAYGWEEGLAGSGSKALAALSAILDSELRSMYSLVASYNSDPKVAQTFNAIFRVNSNLFNRVNASNAGDAAGLPLARELLTEWNKPDFQQILTGMMSAPRESQASLQNRILMALTAIESIRDYVDPRGDSKLEVNLPTQVKSKLD